MSNTVSSNKMKSTIVLENMPQAIQEQIVSLLASDQFQAAREIYQAFQDQVFSQYNK